MSKIKNGGLDQYGIEPYEQQQFKAAGVEGVNTSLMKNVYRSSSHTPLYGVSLPHILQCDVIANNLVGCTRYKLQMKNKKYHKVSK